MRGVWLARFVLAAAAIEFCLAAPAALAWTTKTDVNPVTDEKTLTAMELGWTRGQGGAPDLAIIISCATTGRIGISFIRPTPIGYRLAPGRVRDVQGRVRVDGNTPVAIDLFSANLNGQYMLIGDAKKSEQKKYESTLAVLAQLSTAKTQVAFDADGVSHAFPVRQSADIRTMLTTCKVPGFQ